MIHCSASHFLQPQLGSLVIALRLRNTAIAVSATPATVRVRVALSGPAVPAAGAAALFAELSSLPPGQTAELRFRALCVGLGRVLATISLEIAGLEECEELEAAGPAALVDLIAKRDGGEAFACDDDEVGDGDVNKDHGDEHKGGAVIGGVGGRGSGGGALTFASVQRRSHLRYDAYVVPEIDCLLPSPHNSWERSELEFRGLWSRLAYAEVIALQLRAMRTVAAAGDVDRFLQYVAGCCSSSTEREDKIQIDR